MHHGSLPSVKSESRRTQMMVLQTASGTCRQHIAHKDGSFSLTVDCICRSGGIRVRHTNRVMFGVYKNLINEC